MIHKLLWDGRERRKGEVLQHEEQVIVSHKGLRLPVTAPVPEVSRDQVN